MKIAHVIMAYKNPCQLERLIKRLEHPQFDVFIHLDKKVNIVNYNHLHDIERVAFIENRVLCNWGGFSFVKAITNSIREILLKDEQYEYINLMSAQDYPIKSIDDMYTFLEKHKGDSFISYERSDESAWWKHAITRYELYHFTDFNIKGRYFVQRILNRIAPKRKFPIPGQLYGSATSSWWTISRDCARYVVNYLDLHPKLMRFMKFTWAADEFLYPTIIMNSPFRERVQNNNLRHIEWEEGKSNPRIFELYDFDTLMNSDHFIARKFDTTVDTRVLDKLDELIEYKK